MYNENMKQTRFIPIETCGLQLRESADGQPSRTVVGRPIVFGVRSVNLTPWSDTRVVYEILEPGCISREVLQKSDIILNLTTSGDLYATDETRQIHLKDIKVPSEYNTLTELGNGYTLDVSGERPLLVGGGVGVPPMYELCKQLIKEGKKVSVILGFNTKSEIFYEEEFKALGCDVSITTVDGTKGIKGFVTGAIEDITYTHFYTCGPEPMLKAVWRASNTSGQLSFEERMGCGFGACMGCSCKTLTGYKRICKEGPVMRKEEILWQN